MEEYVYANPGMPQRVSRTIVFEDYSASELLQIFDLKARKHEPPFAYGEGFHDAVSGAIEYMLKNKDRLFGSSFGNAGAIEGLLNTAQNAKTRAVNSKR
jgi:hypothetical protein